MAMSLSGSGFTQPNVGSHMRVDHAGPEACLSDVFSGRCVVIIENLKKVYGFRTAAHDSSGRCQDRLPATRKSCGAIMARLPRHRPRIHDRLCHPAGQGVWMPLDPYPCWTIRLCLVHRWEEHRYTGGHRAVRVTLVYDFVGGHELARHRLMPRPRARACAQRTPGRGTRT
jgi:hypothetical protein